MFVRAQVLQITAKIRVKIYKKVIDYSENKTGFYFFSMDYNIFF